MYRSFDEDVLLSPQRVVADVVAGAAFDDDLELPDVELFRDAWSGHAGERDAEGDADAGADGAAHPRARAMPHVNETSSFRADADRLDAWARRALAANGFGG